CVLPAPGPPGDQDRRRHADLRRPARSDRRLVHLHGLAPGPLGQQLPAPHLTHRRTPAAVPACQAPGTSTCPGQTPTFPPNTQPPPPIRSLRELGTPDCVYLPPTFRGVNTHDE